MPQALREQSKLDPRERKPIPHLPKPFNRPSVEVTTQNRREWQWILPQKIKQDDIVVDMGLIQEDAINLGVAVRIIGRAKTTDFEADKKVWAFSRKP